MASALHAPIARNLGGGQLQRRSLSLSMLMPEKDGIIMYKIRYPYEVRNISNVPDIKAIPIDAAQLDLAKTLISSMIKPFSSINFEDHYRDAILEIVQKKVSGNEMISIETKEDAAPVIDIMEALKRSIEEAKQKKGA